MPHLSRIKKFHLDRSGRTVEAFLALPPGLVPSLCSLEITDNWAIDLKHSAVLQGAPNFHELLLAASQITPAWIYTLPLSQLTTLTLPYARFAPDQVLAIMKLSPNLIQCTFAVAAVAPLNPRLSSSLVLAAPIVHNVQSLTFDLHSKCDEVYEIQQLFLPHLRHFILKSGRILDWDNWWAPSILRSGLLETLVLDDIVVSSQQLGQLLHGTPHLLELGISSGRMITPPVLEEMASGALLPKLRTLRCLIGVTDVDDIGALDLHLDMLEKRREKTTAASHIADVQLKLMTSQRISGVTRLGRMVKEGWNIQHVWQ
ncbi:hypothetical protein D9615_007738 [Tricholomella constricta]|uniref:Uncharacterized protein n=1 Tax=Tricholomella constricta TaxID=117010 RepID=A0A8H5H3X4_9AGAR|nr:hypothetical protein D9615_007738 [Tricholomella constricta]